MQSANIVVFGKIFTWQLGFDWNVNVEVRQDNGHSNWTLMSEWSLGRGCGDLLSIYNDWSPIIRTGEHLSHDLAAVPMNILLKNSLAFANTRHSSNSSMNVAFFASWRACIYSGNLTCLTTSDLFTKCFSIWLQTCKIKSHEFSCNGKNVEELCNLKAV